MSSRNQAVITMISIKELKEKWETQQFRERKKTFTTISGAPIPGYTLLQMLKLTTSTI